MVHFCKHNKLPSIRGAVIIDSYITLEDLPKKCDASRSIIFTDIIKNFKFTNKGGRRLINFIKSISTYPIDIYLGYNSASLTYILATDPYKLFSPTETRANKLFNTLLTDDINQFSYIDNEVIPEEFNTPNSMFLWLLTSDPTLSVQAINEIKIRKSQDPNFLEKDIKLFSEDFPSIKNLAKKYLWKESDVANAFSTILSV